MWTIFNALMAFLAIYWIQQTVLRFISAYEERTKALKGEK